MQTSWNIDEFLVTPSLVTGPVYAIPKYKKLAGKVYHSTISSDPTRILIQTDEILTAKRLIETNFMKRKLLITYGITNAFLFQDKFLQIYFKYVKTKVKQKKYSQFLKVVCHKQWYNLRDLYNSENGSDSSYKACQEKNGQTRKRVPHLSTTTNSYNK